MNELLDRGLGCSHKRLGGVRKQVLIGATNGFYVATEPLISMDYGNVLYQMELPEGMRYIDGRSRNMIGPKLRDALIARNCKLTDTSRSLIKADTKQVECRQAVIDIAAATGSVAIGYIFKTEPIPACYDVSQWSTAFVLFSPEAVKEGSVKAMLRGKSPNTDGLNGVRAMINGVIYQSEALERLPFPDIAPYEVEEVESYMANNYYGCNRKFKKAE